MVFFDVTGRYSFFAEVFSVPTREFISYESKVWLPWFLKRYILRQKIARPPPIIETREIEKYSYSEKAA